MRSFDSVAVATATNGKLVNNNSIKPITNVTMDSRKVTEGSLFVAIKGERVDGHDFMADVFLKGASAVLCDHVPEGISGSCIVVDNTVKGLQDLATWYRSTLDVKVVGITGSVGKTSTKEVVAGTLSAGFRILKTIGNYNNEIGLPLTVLSIDEDTEIAVLEMGISDFGEMRLLSSIAKPDIAVITNIGQAHLEFLKNRDGILRAKTEIFEYMNPSGKVYLNGDDDKLRTVKEVYGHAPVFYGFGKGNDAYPTCIEPMGLGGTKMHIILKDTEFDATINIPGRHMVLNAVCAAQIAKDLGMSDEQIIKGLSSARTISGRSNIIPYKDLGYIIDDCYNASPSSMMAAIDTLMLAEGRKVAVLGDMFELGVNSDAMHAAIGEYAVKAGVDKLICVGDNCIHMYHRAMNTKGRTGIVHYGSLDDLLKNLSIEFKPADNILVKSSNGMGFSKLVGALKNR